MNIYIYIYICVCECVYVRVYVHVCVYVCVTATNVSEARITEMKNIQKQSSLIHTGKDKEARS